MDELIASSRVSSKTRRQHNTFTNIPRKPAIANGGKIIKTRWIDINKGDDDNPVYRSRIVGKEVNNEAMDCMFAGTPH